MKRKSLLPALVPLLAGCYGNDIVLDRARLESDVPIPPPAMAPDSAKAGSIHGQLAVWTMDTEDSVGPGMGWNRAPVGFQGQMQIVAGPHLRWAIGAGYSRTASAWIGPVVSVRNSLLRWDLEMLMGLTRHDGWLEGHVSTRSESGVVVRVDSVRDSPSGGDLWGQWTLRCRAVHSGPWIEGRVLPSFSWGDLTSDRTQSDPTRVRSTMGVLGAGWVQETRGGSLLILGVRMIGIDAGVFPQFLLSVQSPIGRRRD